jgi:hypothetical protein
MDVSTLSGVVISGGMGVVIFILGDFAQAVAARLDTINPTMARVISFFVFILFSFINFRVRGGLNAPPG